MTTSTEGTSEVLADTTDAAVTAPQPARIPQDTLGNRLMLVRAMAGHLSIRDASEMAGLNRGSWQGWERGLRPRDLADVIRRVSETFDVDQSWLLFGGPLAPAHNGAALKPTGPNVTPAYGNKCRLVDMPVVDISPAVGLIGYHRKIVRRSILTPTRTLPTAA